MPRATGEVIKTTTIREVGDATTTNLKTPEFWEFVRNIRPDSAADYILYLYREEPNRIQIDHTTGMFWEVPDYGSVAIGDQESLESAISKDCGGGVYKIICKMRSTGQWITSSKFRIDLGSKPVTPWFQRRLPLIPENRQSTTNTGNVIPLPGDGTVQIANKAIDTIVGQEHAAVQIGVGALSTAANVIKNFAERPNQPDDLTRQFMNVMIQRMLNPPDTLDTMAKFLQLQAQLNPEKQGFGNSFDQFRSIFEFVRQMTGQVQPATSTGAEVVRSLPTIAGQVVDGIREWRMGMEAQRDGVAMMHTPPTRPPAPTPQAIALPPSTRVPPPSVNPEINPGMNGQVPIDRTNQVQGAIVPPSTEFIEQCIVNTFNLPITVQEAAEQVIDFLYTMSDKYVEELAALGETRLMQLFQLRPILKQATGNPARLSEFIRAFLKAYREEKAEETANGVPKPN